MATKNVFLTFEIHLTDAERVKTLQANPPGETSCQTTPPYSGTPPPPQPAACGIIRAPEGAAIEFGNSDNGGVPLPLISPFGGLPPAGKPYISSEWFTVSNPQWATQFPTDVATFKRKSGGWFGIPFLFGTTTQYYWRGIFVYDTPLTDNGAPGGPSLTTPIPIRRWVDAFQIFEGQAVSESGIAETAMQRWMTRDAARAVDGYGFAIRGDSGVRIKTLTGNTTGAGSASNASWERLYVRLRRLPTSETLFWRTRGTSNEAGALCFITPTGQISVYNSTNLAVNTLLGVSSTPLVLNKWYKLDILVKYNGGSDNGSIRLYLNGVAALSIAVPAGVGGLGQQQAHHLSEIGTPAASGYLLKMDIGYWHNAHIPANPANPDNANAVDANENLNGIDWRNGSRAVLVRPNGMAASSAGWGTTWRRLGQRPARPGGPIPPEGVVSTTALALLAVTTDVNRSVRGVPGALGVAAGHIALFNYKGTANGRVGYKRGTDATVFANITQNPSGTLGWNGVMFRPTGAIKPGDLAIGADPLGAPGFELHHEKGNDAVEGKVTTFVATMELVGTFGDEDYPPNVATDLKLPLPFLGIHNAPYPRTTWARTSSPPVSPVVIHSGTYVGAAADLDLTFRSPVHWIWIRKLVTSAGVPKTTRWWSSMLGSSLKDQQSPYPWFIPNQEIDADFTPTTVAPSGVGTLPNRSTQVATIVAANPSYFDGTDDSKRELLKIIGRTLNTDNPSDGNNWGLLRKNNQGGKIPADILVWKPTGEHVDVLTDTGATWIVHGPIPPEWEWLALAADTANEQRTIVRIAGSHIDVNEAGATYVYIAVSDPGQRFMMNGATANRTVEGVPITHNLIDAGFTGQGGWFIDQRPGILTAAPMLYKGPGNALASLTYLAGSQQNNAVTFGAGKLTIDTGASLSAVDHHLAFSLWRMDDTSSDPGKANIVRITSYVGDGAGGTRVIPLFGGNLPAATGKRPLWAIVIPNTSPDTIYKDASHTGGNSNNHQDGSQTVTGITAGGPDTITVGTTLNVNAVTYNVFVLMGLDVAGNDGFSGHGEFIPVEPDVAPGTQWGSNPEPPVLGGGPGAGDSPGSPGGGADDTDTDFAADCLPFTQRVAQTALGRIGISKRLVNLATDLTEEADVIRQNWSHALLTTLHDFPWPFATRYATLTLLAGTTTTPVNRDWQYSYKKPSDCVFERRVVVVRQGAVDPTPPPMQLSYDNAGFERIFTNQPNAILEYTARPLCSAGRGDPLFRDALAWSLAKQIAGPLTRIVDVQKLASDAYDAAIAKAVLVIKPGNPGPRTNVDVTGQDGGPGCLAANVAVVNRALIRIGAQTIANLDTEQSREAEAARVIFEPELRATLRDFPWAFATAYNSAPTLAGGSDATPINDDWQYSYRYPTDCVFVRRIVSETRRAFDPDPEKFRVGNDATGLVFFANRKDPTIEYTARIPCVVGRSDDLFKDAFAWRLAACLAPSLAHIDPAKPEQHGRGPEQRPKERKVTEAQLRARAADAAWRMYYGVIEKARAADAREAQPEKPGDADWILGRN